MDGGVGLAELIGLKAGVVCPVVASQRYNGDKGGVALGGAVMAHVFGDREGIAGGRAGALHGMLKPSGATMLKNLRDIGTGNVGMSIKMVGDSGGKVGETFTIVMVRAGGGHSAWSTMVHPLREAELAGGELG